MTRRRAGSKPDSIGNGKHSPENYIALKVSSVRREDPHRPERNWGLNPQKTCVPTETDTGTHYLTEGVIKHTNSNWSKLAPSAEDHLEGEGWTCPFLACRAPSQECYKGAAATFQWVMVFQHIRDRLFQNRSRRAVIEKQKGEGKKKKSSFGSFQNSSIQPKSGKLLQGVHCMWTEQDAFHNRKMQLCIFIPRNWCNAWLPHNKSHIRSLMLWGREKPLNLTLVRTGLRLKGHICG